MSPPRQSILGSSCDACAADSNQELSPPRYSLSVTSIALAANHILKVIFIQAVAQLHLSLVGNNCSN